MPNPAPPGRTAAQITDLEEMARIALSCRALGGSHSFEIAEIEAGVRQANGMTTYRLVQKFKALPVEIQNRLIIACYRDVAQVRSLIDQTEVRARVVQRAKPRKATPAQREVLGTAANINELAERLASLTFDGQEEASEVHVHDGAAIRRFKAQRYFKKAGDRDEWPVLQHGETNRQVLRHFNGLKGHLEVIGEERGWFAVVTEMLTAENMMTVEDDGEVER